MAARQRVLVQIRVGAVQIPLGMFGDGHSGMGFTILDRMQGHAQEVESYAAVRTRPQLLVGSVHIQVDPLAPILLSFWRADYWSAAVVRAPTHRGNLPGSNRAGQRHYFSAYLLGQRAKQRRTVHHEARANDITPGDLHHLQR
jgi:hypothetical protein